MRNRTAHRRLGVVPRWIRSVVLLAVAAVTLAACSGGNAATGGGSNAGGGSTAKAHGPVEVALILKELTNPYFISIENSARIRAAKFGVKLTISAGSSDDDTNHPDRRDR